MKVKAKQGVQVPREDNPRRYVSDSETLEVAESAYYLRRIADGDLMQVSEDVPAAVTSEAPAPVKAAVPEPAAAAVNTEAAPVTADKGAK